MIRKVIFILVSLHILPILQSCCNNDPISYQWTHFTTSILDNSREEPKVLSENYQEINKKAYGVRVNLIDNQQSTYGDATTSFISSAKAFKCVPGYERSNNVKSVYITTVFDYSNQYKAGDDVSHLFMARIEERTNYIQIKDVITSLNNQNDGIFDLYLLDTTGFELKQAFQIFIELDNNITIANTTQEMTFY